MSNRRLTRTESSRILTCIEAIDAGFGFVSSCSGCDYYTANRPLNSIAMKKPRSQLSRYWQCTKTHVYGQLSSASQTNTPYQPVQRTKYNSLIATSLEGSNSNEMSSTKRVRLFSPTPTPTSSETIPASGAENPVIEKYLLESRCEKALRDCNEAIIKLDKAVLERESAVAKAEEATVELNRVVAVHDEACRRQDIAGAERYKALCERDSAVYERDEALCERDEAMKKYHSSLDKISELEKELSISEKTRENLNEQYQKLQDTNQRLSSLLSTLSEEQDSLRSRVHALETRAVSNRVGAPLRARAISNGVGAPLRAIQNLASKLFPLDHANKRLQSMFDLIYENRKSFRKHVNNQVRESILEAVRLSSCKEIKKFYTGWKFLKALDCSTQSLNQVTFFKPY